MIKLAPYLLCVLLVGLFGAMLAVPSTDSAASRCDALYQFTDVSHAVEPGVLVPAADSVPAYCRVRGVIAGTIRFEVAMPIDGWRQRLMFHAVGGSAGRIGDTESLLARGFAMASTDTGHEGTTPDDNIFFRDQNALINWGSRGVRLTTLLAKRIIATFYSDEVEHSYIWGCSRGGHAGLEEALRYPEDYDGVIAGAPATEWAEELLSWSVAGARKQEENPLTAASLSLLDANSTEQCDLLDGVADGVIGHPQACTPEALKLERLSCDEGQQADCLTAGQIETAKFMYEGLTDKSGRVISPAVSPGGESQGDWMLWVTGNPAFIPDSAQKASSEIIEHLLYRRPGFSLDAFDPVHERHLPAAAAASVELPSPNFTRFHERGGKLIVYNGWNDVPIRPGKILSFMAEAERLSGGADKMAEFSRLYLVPGMLHCWGGAGAWAADYVTPMVAWVENDIAPSAIIASQPGITNWFEAAATLGESASWYERALQVGAAKAEADRFTRPICPYPQVASYQGSGDPDDAANFSCVDG